MTHQELSGKPPPPNHSSASSKTTTEFLGPAFGRTDFSRIFIFEPPDFFADFLAGFFLLIFVGKSAQKNPPGKSPAKSSEIYTTKILQHISADCPGQEFPQPRLSRVKGRVGHLRCEGVAERNCGKNHCGGWQLFLQNEMRKSDIFQVASNVSLVAEAGCKRRA